MADNNNFQKGEGEGDQEKMMIRPNLTDQSIFLEKI